MVKYDYLKKYVVEKSPGAEINSFYKVEDEEIKNAEEKLGYKFPEELKEFWREIGSGLFRSSVPEKGITQKDWVNALLYPSEIATILLEGAESEMISEEMLDLLEEDEVPFFNVTGFDYLTYKTTDESFKVYNLGIKVADSLEEFVHQLYYESPTYYLNIED
jgi:hypothetical protein